MRSKLAIFVTFFGWLIMAAYMLYDYATYGSDIFEHLFAFDEFPEALMHIIVFISPIGSSITGYLIYERKKLYDRTYISEKKLRQGLNEWESMLDAIPHGIMLLDKDFNILKANKYFSNLSGISQNDLKYRKCHDVIHRKDMPVDECPLAKAKESGKTETLEYYNQQFNKYFMVSATPIYDEDGTISAYAHPVFDITDIKTKEEEIVDSKNAFLNMLKDIHSSHVELQRLYHDLIVAFSIAIDAKSPWTKGHSERVTSYAVSIAKEMELSEEDIETVSTAGLLHDIGKIGTYDVILEKPTKLTAEEFALVKLHSIKGEQILKPIREFYNVLPIIKSHHEKVDGSGYPDGLRGEEIPLLARIMCVADSFDSMITDRPYRRAPGLEYAISELKSCSGEHFDSQVVSAFLNVLENNK